MSIFQCYSCGVSSTSRTRLFFFCWTAPVTLWRVSELACLFNSSSVTSERTTQFGVRLILSTSKYLNVLNLVYMCICENESWGHYRIIIWPKTDASWQTASWDTFLQLFCANNKKNKQSVGLLKAPLLETCSLCCWQPVKGLTDWRVSLFLNISERRCTVVWRGGC